MTKKGASISVYKITDANAIFTESAPRPIPSNSCDVRVCVCVSVPSRIIVDYAQTVRVSVFCHKIENLRNLIFGLEIN